MRPRRANPIHNLDPRRDLVPTRERWPNGDGVGKTFRIEPDLTAHQGGAILTISPGAGAAEAPLTPRTVTVIGVSKDIAGFRITDVRQAGVFLPTTVDAPNTFLIARIQGDPDLARQTLLERLTRIDPNMGRIITLRSVARIETFLLTSAFSVSMILGISLLRHQLLFVLDC